MYKSSYTDTTQETIDRFLTLRAKGERIGNKQMLQRKLFGYYGKNA